MTHLEIRKKFLAYFEDKGHKVAPSSSLIPEDSSVLFTTAGMQQFKPYYLEEESPYGDRVVSIQKCIRTSDIKEVGDKTHLTFFEMLGNFSFKSNYFKREAIEFGYEFVTKELGIPLGKITISVFKGAPNSNYPDDKESLEIWKELGIPEDKIFFGDEKDNFWGPTGDKGPCGPTTEMYVDGVEIWNIVFNEYFCEKDHKGKQHVLPLTHKGIDTGMGLDRLAVTLQGVGNVFETDLFASIISEIRGKDLYDQAQNTRSERIIADHLRSAVFMIADGVLPSNTEQGYILRRLIRTAIRHARILNLPDDVYERVVDVIVTNIYGDVYPELNKQKENILEVLLREKGKFSKTVDKGLKELGRLINELIKRGEDTISGVDAFMLYSSYGFPIEMTQELAAERKVNVDRIGFEKEVEKHKEKSRAGAEKKFGGHGLVLDTGELKAADEEGVKKVTRLHTATHILHTVLRNFFGNKVQQRGSDITVDRLRLDFTFPHKMTDEEKKMVEDGVNKVIEQGLEVKMEEMSFEQAVKSGALHFFKGRYPGMVKIYSIGDFSRECCGGPHVTNTKEIGHFKILKEESVSGGVRRLRANVE
jgi:alanyl-tRNA synthetase